MKTFFVFALTLVLASGLAACAPEWFTLEPSPATCPRDALPSGGCSAPADACTYVENTGTSRRAPRYQRCVCTANTWTCTVSLGPPGA